MDYDALVVGAGIAGMESALTLGDMGFRVLLVEKEPSVGGKMILLSKVFPTLDCASCISTPKMAAVAHHPNVKLLNYSEVERISRNGDGTFDVVVKRKAAFVDPARCTGCGDCEKACTVPVPDRFNFGLVAHRAAHIPFPQAVPKKAVITREGTSPCTYSCPAGVKAHGYIALVRAGRYDEAFRLHMEDAPLPGVLSRACYAPCEAACTRGELDGSLRIRMIKRFMVDRYYEEHPEPEYAPPEKSREQKVAVVGSGPAGLAAAYFLAREGFRVKVFEAMEEPGGMLRYGIPPYRLPREVLDRDLRNITALGVEIETCHRVKSIKKLKEEFDAVFISVGTFSPIELGIEGENFEGVMNSIEFLKRAFSERGRFLAGKKVLVVGGGNVAIDSARTALRLGAREVEIVYRRTRDEMPAHRWEVEAALEEGVKIRELAAPVRFEGTSGELTGAVVVRMRLGELDESGRRRPIPIEGSEFSIPADAIILAVGLKPETSVFADELELNEDGTVKVDPGTLETSLSGVFAGGDAVTGPSMIIQAIGQGKRAAFFISRYLENGETSGLEFPELLPPVEKEKVLRGGSGFSRDGNGKPTPKSRVLVREIPPEKRTRSMEEVEQPFSEEEALRSAGRCLDCAVCSLCGECVRVCPSGAIDFSMREIVEEYRVGSVIFSTGFRLYDPGLKEQYGFGKFPNVITAMQMDRLLAPTRPFNSVLRPSDGKVPDNIAYVLCVGSRDRTADNPYCSRVCCMYSIKQAQLILGAVPLADVTIYYMDIRAFGKGYEEFFEQAKAMGIYFVKGRVARVEEKADGNLLVYYEDIEGSGRVEVAEHDLVVLSVGLLPGSDLSGMIEGESLELSELMFARERDEILDPGRTNLEGVFVAGAAVGPRDIPDTVLHSGAVAAQVAARLMKMRSVRT